MLAGKFRNALVRCGAKQSFISDVKACQYGTYGEYAGLDTDGDDEEGKAGKSINVNIMKTAIQLLPDRKKGEKHPYWRGIVAGIQTDDENGKAYMVVDLHPCHEDSRSVVVDLDLAIKDRELQLVPGLMLTEEWKLVTPAHPTVVVAASDALDSNQFPVEQFPDSAS